MENTVGFDFGREDETVMAFGTVSPEGNVTLDGVVRVPVQDTQANLERKLDLMITRAAALEGTNDELRAMNRKLSDSLVTRTKDLDIMRTHNLVQSDKLTELDAMLRQKDQEINDLEETLVEAADELDAKQEEIKGLYEALDRAAAKLAVREDALAEVAAESADLRRRFLATLQEYVRE